MYAIRSYYGLAGCGGDLVGVRLPIPYLAEGRSLDLQPRVAALPLLYAYREAMNIILEEGLDARIKRHRICSQALYSGLSAIGLTRNNFV